MGITANGKENAFALGLANTIDQMEVRDNGSKIGDTKDISVSHDSNHPGRIVLDSSVDYDVSANDEINEIVFIFDDVDDDQSGRKGDQWVIDLGDGYTFEYDGTFTVEDVWVQFTGPSDPSSDGGITEAGRTSLVEDGLKDSIDEIRGNQYFKATQSNIDGNSINFSQSQDEPMSLDTPVQLETDSTDYPSNIDRISLYQQTPVDDELFYLNFSERTFDYPARITFTSIEIDID